MSVLAVLGIAKTLGITDWVSDKLSSSDNGAAKIAAKVLDFASQATGESDPVKINKALIADPTLAIQLKQTLLDNEHELDMAPYKDRQDARAMHNQHPEQADKIADRIMKYNLPYILFLLVANCLAMFYLRDYSAILAIVSNLIGMTLKSLFDERNCVTGFYFGSSMGSKNKDVNHPLKGNE
jgi:hypothetical protein